MGGLYRLVYASKSLLPSAEAEAGIAQILTASRRNNARLGVTGAMMFNGGAFAQVLEGPQLSVGDIFERVVRDPRHDNVVVLEGNPVKERSFMDWSMAFVGRSARGQALWDRLAAESEFDFKQLSGDVVLSMLYSLVLEEETLGDLMLTQVNALQFAGS